MVEIIGQERLKQQIDSYSMLSMVPHTIIIDGPFGSGKHLFANYIADKFLCDIEELSEIDTDVISDITTSPITKFYLLDIDKLAANKKVLNIENAMLKLLEEPTETCYLILLAKTYSNIIDTIKNRCVRFKIDEYTYRNFIGWNIEQNLIDIFNTPGKIKLAQQYNISEYIQLADTILTKIDKANLSNTLTLVDRFAFDEENKDALPFDLFIDIMLYVINKSMQEKYFPYLISVYRSFNQLCQDMTILNVNKKHLFSAFLFDIKGIIEEWTLKNSKTD